MTTQTKTTWRKVKAEEICMRVTDGTHDTPKRLAVGHPLITSKQLTGGIISATEYFIDEKDFDEVNRRSKVDQWDILFGMIGTIGETVIIKDKNPEFAIKNIGLFKTGGDKTVSEWLYYYLKSPAGKAYIKSVTRGTSQGYVPLESLRAFPVFVPENRKEQEKIVAILSAFDDKIELNNKISRTLEQMAQAIFKEWFVKFRFPGHEKVKMVDFELGKIPEGWEAKKISEIIDVRGGLSYKAEFMNGKSGVPMITMGAIGLDSNIITKGIKTYAGKYSERFRLKTGDIVMSTRDVTQDRSILGRPIRIPAYLKDEAILATNLYKVENTSDVPNTFIFFLFQTNAFREQMIASAKGSNILMLTRDAVLNFEFIQPDKTTLERFDTTAQSVLEKKEVLFKENQKLAALRDLLLPRLMSGEIRV